MKVIIVCSKIDEGCCSQVKSGLQATIPNVQVEVTDKVANDIGDVISIVAFQLNEQDAEKVNSECRAAGVNFFWAGFDSPSQTISVFCDPNPGLAKDFQGENSRGDNDLLVTEAVTSLAESSYKITCCKKHHLEAGSSVGLFHGDSIRIDAANIQVTADKEFMVSVEEEIDCDKSYIVKLLLRPRDSLVYETFAVSKKPIGVVKQKELHLIDSRAIGLVHQLIGCVMGCEIWSSMVEKSRLPLSQWVTVELLENAAKTKCDPLQSLVVLGEDSVLTNAICRQIKASFPGVPISVQSHQKFLEEKDFKADLVISSGAVYEFRSKVAEVCKDRSIKFIDAGTAHQQGHIQAIYPDISELFDAIIDYEDLSDEAPHCVIKSFPTNLDHCIQWAVRKCNSMKKERSQDHNFEQRAKDKFTKYFITKPLKLLHDFPPGDDGNSSWKPPKRQPRTDVVLDMENELHCLFISSLSQLYKETANLLAEDEFEISRDLESDLILALTKLRAFTYGIPNLEADKDVCAKARKEKRCSGSMASLVATLVSLEVAKIQIGSSPQDWWISERSGFSIVGSRSCPRVRTVGKLTLTSWENVEVAGDSSWTIQTFLDHMESNVGLVVNMITQSSKMIYVKALPTHANKKKKTLVSLLSFDANDTSIVKIAVDGVDDLVAVHLAICKK